MLPSVQDGYFSDKNSYQYFDMNNIKEFKDNPLCRRDFWQITGPVSAGITLLAVTAILWGRLRVIIWHAIYKLWRLEFIEDKADDIELQRRTSWFSRY